MAWSGLSEEVRRRERVIRIFPNRESAVRLLGAILLERHEQWTTGHRYLDMASYWHWRSEQRSEPAAGGGPVAAARTPRVARGDGPLLREAVIGRGEADVGAEGGSAWGTGATAFGKMTARPR